MANTIKITVTASLRDSELIFRILNFKEDVHREIIRGGYGVVADPAAIDRALEAVTISIPRKRDFDHMVPFLNEALKRNKVEQAIEIAIERT